MAKNIIEIYTNYLHVLLATLDVCHVLGNIFSDFFKTKWQTGVWRIILMAGKILLKFITIICVRIKLIKIVQRQQLGFDVICQNLKCQSPAENTKKVTNKNN